MHATWSYPVTVHDVCDNRGCGGEAAGNKGVVGFDAETLPMGRAYGNCWEAVMKTKGRVLHN